MDDLDGLYYDHYHYNSNKILPDGSTCLELYYRRSTFTISFDTNGANESISTMYDVRYEHILYEPQIERPGYSLVKWVDTNNEDEEYYFGNPINKDLVLKAIWQANTNTSYTVCIHKENLEGDYDVIETTYYGTTDTEIDVDQFIEEFTGFTFASKNANSEVTREDSTTYVNLNGDGSTYIDIYYERNEYTVTFDCNNADFNISDTTMKYDTILEDPNLTKAGYTLVKWVDHNNGDAEYTFGNAVTSNLDLEAIWQVNENTKYTIRYYLPSLDGEDVVQEETHYGITDTALDYNDFKKEFEGFYFSDKNQNYSYIRGDEITFINLYYQRNTYGINIYCDEQTTYQLNTTDFRHGKEITINASLYGNLGYLFDGIYADSDYHNLLTDSTEYTFTVYENTEFYIKAKAIDELADFKFNSTEEDIVITGIKDGVTITDLVIPDVVTYIGSNAFYNNQDIKTVYITKNIKAIETSAFTYCNLDSVEFDSECNIDYIAYNAFAYVTVGEITFCDNIKELKESSFYNIKTRKLVLPKNLEIIGDYALQASWNNQHSRNEFVLDTLIIPNSVKKIGANALTYTQINNLIFEDGINIEEMGDNPFSYCHIKNLTLPNNLEEIPTSTFGYSMEDSVLFIPKSVKTIGYKTFYGASISKIVFEEESLLEEIGDDAFEQNTQLTGLIILPDNLKTIGKNAFYGCSMSSIKLNSELCAIGEKAFYNCSQLNIIYNNSCLVLEAGSTDYGYVAYNVASNSDIYSSEYAQNVIVDGYFVYYVEYTDGVETDRTLLSYTGDEKVINTINPRTKRIADRVFSNKNMYDVIIPDQVVEIGDYAFYNCKYLSRITLGPCVETFGYCAFNSCDKLVEIYNKSEHITLEAGSTENGWIAYNAINIYEGTNYTPNVHLDGDFIVFNYNDECYLLGKYEDVSNDELIIPSYVTIIYANAFKDIKSITKVDLSSSNVKLIMDYAFYNMQYVSYIALPETLEEIGESAFNCVGVSTGGISYFNIENCTNLKTIRPYAFNELYYKGDLVLPESVETLEGDAFCRSYIKSITLGSKIRELAAFSNCYYLERVYFSSENNVEEIVYHAFYNCYRLNYFEVGSKVNIIGAKAFENCYKLYEVCNKSNIEIEKDYELFGGIGYYAYVIYTDERPETFYSDDNFVYFVDGDDLVLVDYIGESTTVVIPNTITIIGHAAFFERDTLEICFEENSSVSKVEAFAFYRYSGSHLDLRDMPNLEEIENDAFVSTNFYTLYISKKITSLGIYAFNNVSADIIIFDIETPLTTIVEGLFDGAYYNALLIPSQITFIKGYNNPNTWHTVNHIFYYGTAEQLANLVIDDLDNNRLISYFENIVCLYSETEEEGNYFRFDEENYPITWGAYLAGQKLKRVVELMKYYLEEAYNNPESEYITHDETGIYEYMFGLRLETEGLYNFLNSEGSSEISLFDSISGSDLALYYDGKKYEAGLDNYTKVDGFYVEINSTYTDFIIRREY